MPTPTAVRRAVAGLKQSHRFSPRAIISTIFGDMLWPHGASIWLGSLVEAAALFDIGESHARTSTLRLSYDGWLKSVRVGKLSYYSMGDEVMHDYIAVVYGTPNESRVGDWTMVFTGVADLAKQRYVRLRQALIWEGVGQLAPHVFIVPSSDTGRLNKVLDEFQLADRVQMLSAQTLPTKDPEMARRMVRDAWALAEIEKRYEGFLKRFRPIYQILERHAGEIEPEYCFVIRALLVLEYRVIAVRDPHLPASLLPTPWPGHSAFNLCKAIYQQVLAGSEAYLGASFKALDGPLPQIRPIFWGRFGGLEAPAAS
ncbi:MAG: PaaX family transcriptional regulator C-terminal domain-containing protein [Burkholderiaceae bacterium]